MIQLDNNAAAAAMAKAYADEKCPSCGTDVETFGSLISPFTGGVWFFCDRCVDPDKIVLLLPAPAASWRGG